MQHTGEWTFRDVYLRGMEYYRENLFEEDGAPRLFSNRSRPHDIHGSAQGVLSFCKLATIDPSALPFAINFAQWALDHMQSPTGGFYYRKHAFFTRRESLMRWNNSWMAWALSELLLTLDQRKE